MGSRLAGHKKGRKARGRNERNRRLGAALQLGQHRELRAGRDPLNGDGSFTRPGGGKWRFRDGTLQLSFDGGPAKYGGTVDGNVTSGAMSTFVGLNGSWYLVKQGTVGLDDDADEAEGDRPTRRATSFRRGHERAST